MKMIVLKVDEETYRKLEELARKKGLLSASEVAKALLLKAINEVSAVERERISVESQAAAVKAKGVLEKLVAMIDRKIQDKVNPFTSKIDDLARKYADLVERIESLESKISELEQKLSAFEDQVTKHRSIATIERAEGRREKRRRSIMEILKEQGVLFESDIASRIRDRDTFFLKLQRLGAIVLELKNERVAIDPDFWKSFVEKVQNITTNAEEEIAKALDEREFRLFKALRESALIYFDAVSGKWRLLL